MRHRDRFRQFARQMALPGLAACAVLACSATAHAQGAVRFVSALGNDADPCTRTAPCRTLQRGVDATQNGGGELQFLDSGGYGAATIRKSITISAEGVAANVGTLTIDSPNAVVVLRGLLINGRGATLSGVVIADASAVHIVRCEVERFPQGGIFLAAVSADLFVTDSIVRLNGSAGLQVKGGATTARLTVDNSRFENNGGSGLLIDRITSTLTRVVASGNDGDGIEQTGGRMNITWTTAANNGGNGFHVSGTGDMTLEYAVARGNTASGLLVAGAAGTISNSTFTYNNAGTVSSAASSVVFTRKNNTFRANTTVDQLGTVTQLNPL